METSSSVPPEGVNSLNYPNAGTGGTPVSFFVLWPLPIKSTQSGILVDGGNLRANVNETPDKVSLRQSNQIVTKQLFTVASRA